MSNRLATVLILVLFCYVNNIRSQLNKENVGIPLPSFKIGQGQDPLINNKNDKLKKNLRSSHPNSVTPIRGLASLQYIANPSADKYVQNLIKLPLLLHGIQRKSGADKAVRVESIITAHKQVVSGQIIYLTLRVVEVECPIGTQNVDDCRRDYSEDPYICEMAVWERPWLNSTKIVEEKSRCEEFESYAAFKNGKRGSDDAFERGFLEYPLSALPQPIDEDQLALEAFNFVDSGSQSKFKGKMITHSISSVKFNPTRNITKIEVKVEYGFTLCIKLPNLKIDTRACPIDAGRNTYVCSIDVASDPRFPTKYKVVPDDDEYIDCEERQPVEELLVVPVKAPCTGCLQSLSLNDPKVFELAEFAIEEYDKKDDSEELHRMKKLIKAHYQVESSIKYLLTMEIIETECKKSMNAINMDRSFCAEDHNDTPEICEFLINEQPWQKSKELLSAKCSDDEGLVNKDEFIVPVFGGSARLSLSDSSFSASSTKLSSASALNDSDVFKRSITFVLEYLNLLEHSTEDEDDGLLVLQKVHQTESKSGPFGEEHHLVLELGETICSRFQRSQDCPLKHGEENEVCESRVVIGRSGEPERITYLACDDLDDFMKRKLTPYEHLQQPFFTGQAGSPSASGSPQSTHPVSHTDDPLTAELAQLVLNQYNLQSDDDELYKLGHVVTFLKQNNHLSTYLIELELLETECKKYQPVADVAKCPIEVGEDPQFCQAEIALDAANPSKKHVTRLFCDERDNFYKKKIAKAEPSSLPGQWKNENTKSDKINILGKLISDEFDLRSDKENIFVLYRVLEAKAQSAGLKHFLRVELAETVCPKYKPKINKTRCMVDHGEDLKVCQAIVVDQPWNNGHEVTDMSCSEKDRSHEDHSIEVLYREVHPSAHVRPKFIHSVYHKNLGSKESDESNEKYYGNGAHVHHSNERESEEIFLSSNRSPRGKFDLSASVPFRRRDLTRDDDDDLDSDNGKDSHSREHVRGRGRRSVPLETKKAEHSIFKGSEAVSIDRNVMNLAARGIFTLDFITHEKTTRKIKDILQATKKGEQWLFMLRVSNTVCTRKDVSSFEEVSACEFSPESPNYLCMMTLLLNSNNVVKIKKSKCYPELS